QDAGLRDLLELAQILDGEVERPVDEAVHAQAPRPLERRRPEVATDEEDRRGGEQTIEVFGGRGPVLRLARVQEEGAAAGGPRRQRAPGERGRAELDEVSASHVPIE